MGRRRTSGWWWTPVLVAGPVAVAAWPAARAQQVTSCLPCEQRLELPSAARGAPASGLAADLRLRWVGPTRPLDRMVGRVWVTMRLDQQLWGTSPSFGDRLELGLEPDRTGLQSGGGSGGFEVPPMRLGPSSPVGGGTGVSSSGGLNLPTFSGSSSSSAFGW